jgi:uncharacterized membrane protein HdeD (DUF308 family)
MGLIYILFGIIAVTAPVIPIFSLFTVFCFYVILTGFFILLTGVTGTTDSRHLKIVQGIASMAAGLYIFTQPISAYDRAVMVVAIWAILNGLIEILHGRKLREIIPGGLLMIIIGIIYMLLSISIAVDLIRNDAALVVTFGSIIILNGIFLLILALKFKKLNQ